MKVVATGSGGIWGGMAEILTQSLLVNLSGSEIGSVSSPRDIGLR